MSKRLIYISHWRIPSSKTMSPLILKTCEGFVNMGYEVELWLPQRRNNEEGDPFQIHGISTRFPIRRLFVLDFMHVLGKAGFLLMVATYNISLFWALRREKDAVLYGHDMRDFLLPSLRGLPCFIEIHDFYESGLRALNGFVLARTTGLIVTNSIKMKRLHEAYRFPEERMLRQPNAVDIERFSISLTKEEARHSLGLPKDETIILYTGHLFGWKGVHTLAQAAPLLPHARVYFVGGTKEDRAALQTFVSEKNIEVSFVPHQPHSLMPVYQRAADVLVLPNTAKEAASKYETSPVKLFEYLASGTPLAVSDLPSLREVVSEKEAYFFTPDSPEALAAAVEKALSADDAARRAAAVRLAKSYTWEVRASRITEFLKRFT